jgi:hypothetical protein
MTSRPMTIAAKQTEFLLSVMSRRFDSRRGLADGRMETPWKVACLRTTSTFGANLPAKPAAQQG